MSSSNSKEMTMSEAHDNITLTNGAEQAATSPNAASAQATTKTTFWQATPELDVYESASEFLIELDVPGADPSSVDVQVEGSELHVRARQAPSARYSDVALASFQRHFELPGDVDAQSASATLTDGVLQIRIQKSQALRRVKIPVNAN
jgi:HSP20 family protein